MKQGGHICLYLLVLLVSCSMAGGDGHAGQNHDDCATLKSVRSWMGNDRIRFVFDFEGPPPSPCRAFVLHDKPRLVVDFPDSLPSAGLSDSDICNDSLVRSWTVSRENFRTLRFEAPLAYDLPPGNVKISVLKEPSRFVVDVNKVFDRKISLAVTGRVAWSRREKADSRGYIMVNRLEFPGDLKNVALKILSANDDMKSRETTTSMASRHHALAAVNGGFFANSGGPLGLVFVDGKALAPHVKTRPPRTALVITRNNRVLFEKMILSDKGPATADGTLFTGARHILGCGPRVLKDGAVSVTADEEELGKSGNDITRRAGRTAVAVTRKGTLALYTVTGYFESHNSGVRLEELGELLKEDHGRDAFCLDGGHSSMMIVKGSPVSRAPGNKVPERKVANCLALFEDGDCRFPCRIEGKAERDELPADGRSQAAIEIRVTDSQGRPVPDGTPVRFFATLGSVPWYGNTKGGMARCTFTSAHVPGRAIVTAECGFARAEAAVLECKAGEPSSLKADRSPLFLPSTPNGEGDRGELLQVLVRDRYSNPLAAVSLQAGILEGSSAISTLQGVTNARGVAEFRVPGSMRGNLIRVSCGKLSLVVPEKSALPEHPDRGGLPAKDTEKGK